MLLRVRLLAPVLAFTAALTAAPALAGDQPVPNLAAGMRMYVDPQTGKVGVPPRSLPGPAREPAPGSLRRIAPGFREVPVTAAPGGMKVELGDRYRTAVTRRIDSPGATHECVQSSAAPQ